MAFTSPGLVQVQSTDETASFNTLYHTTIGGDEYSYNFIGVNNRAKGPLNSNSQQQTGLHIAYDTGGPATRGLQTSLLVSTVLTAPTDSTEANPCIAGLGFQTIAKTNGRGSVWGGYGGASLAPNAGGSWTNVIGLEVNNYVYPGNVLKNRFGLLLTNFASVHASMHEAALAICGTGGAFQDVGWNWGIMFGNTSGAFPMAKTGTFIIGLGGQTVARGVDFEHVTITDKAWVSPGASIDGQGNGQLRNLSITNLPLADPHAIGALWCNGGVVMVSLG